MGKIPCSGVNCPICDMLGPPTIVLVPVWDEKTKTIVNLKMSKWMYDKQIKPFIDKGVKLILPKEE